MDFCGICRAFAAQFRSRWRAAFPTILFFAVLFLTVSLLFGSRNAMVVSSTTTLNTYTHVTDAMRQNAADKIDRQFLEETLTAFQNVSFGGTEEEHAKMEQMINDYENELQE